MRRKKTIVAIVLILVGIMSGTFAWASSKVKFVNNSASSVEVTIQTMMPGGTAPDPKETFTLPAKTTRNYDVMSPCIKGLWLNSVQKLYFQDDAVVAFRCLNLFNLKLLITIKVDGNSEITQE